jgi:nicotinamide-nucleotide amidase
MNKMGCEYLQEKESFENIIGEYLIENKLTIATAESCTGGLLAGRLINYPGISAAFLEGMVTYSNEAKHRRLGVKEETLEKYGAVSRETALEMARGAAEAAGVDIGISTTGIAGPGGGTVEKPIGLVYVGICIRGKASCMELRLSGDRQNVRTTTVDKALEYLKSQLIGK